MIFRCVSNVSQVMNKINREDRMNNRWLKNKCYCHELDQSRSVQCYQSDYTRTIEKYGCHLGSGQSPNKYLAALSLYTNIFLKGNTEWPLSVLLHNFWKYTLKLCFWYDKWVCWHPCSLFLTELKKKFVDPIS